jgi:hypothetical protein
MVAKKTFLDFINSAKSIYGDKYDYYKVIYKNTSTKVEIICPIHGSFFKTPSKFINAKQECKECNGYIIWTWDKFVKKANAYHKKKYIYPKQTFINTKIKHKIICPVHGEFMQSIFHHLKGGCNQCGIDLRNKNQRDTKIEFVEKANLLFGEKYNYSEVKYFNSQTEVYIICPTHGKFSMKPNSHLNGQNCPKCGRINANRNIRTSYNIALKRFKSVHGNKYEYLEETYIDFTTKMVMRCKIHGEFSNTPHAHYSMKAGCRKCGILTTAKKNRYDFSEIINAFRKVHSNRYVYDINSYSGVENKIRIKCKKHGWFEQSVSGHKGGNGCSDCSYELIGDRTRVTLDDFLVESEVVHGNTYDYSKINWIDQYTDVSIGCKKKNHGFFLQNPRDHKRGSGCPKCNHSRGERLILDWLQENEIDSIPQHTFSDLKHKSFLRCDFFVPDYNLVIEYNGIQHYFPVEHFGGKQSLIDTQARDKIKQDYCLDNDIAFEVIKYDEDIVLELNKIFN